MAEALRRAGRALVPGTVRGIATALRSAEPELDGPGVDTDPAVHRATYLRVLRGLGLDDEVVASLYAVESDPLLNRFAQDAGPTLRALSTAGLRLAVVSDIHVDIGPAFAAAGIADVVDVFTLSFEQRQQKPDPRLFLAALDALGVRPDEALMVGDRSGPDGGAVDVGIPTLLLPPLRDPADRRLHRVVAACGLRTD